jgi:hypothetical protein
MEERVANLYFRSELRPDKEHEKGSFCHPQPVLPTLCASAEAAISIIRTDTSDISFLNGLAPYRGVV